MDASSVPHTCVKLSEHHFHLVNSKHTFVLRVGEDYLVHQGVARGAVDGYVAIAHSFVLNPWHAIP